MRSLEEIADQLVADWRTKASRRRLPPALRAADLDEAYAIQALVQRRHGEARGPIAGRKIAVSSKPMQELCGIDHPVAGAFFATDLIQSPAEVPASAFRHMGLEFELALTLGEDVIPGRGPQDARSARDLIAKAQPAFELIEDLGADYGQLDAQTLVSENAWCAGVVLGDEIEGWQSLDLADLPALVEQDGKDPEAANTGAADPLGSLAWVLNHFGARGETVRAGEVVITGSAVRTRFPEAGDSFRYSIGEKAAVELRIA